MKDPALLSFATGVGLRSTITIAVFLICLLGIGSAVGLVGLTTLLRESGEEAGAALNSLRILEAAEVDLLLHARGKDAAVRAANASEVRRRLDQAAEHVTSAQEQDALSRAFAGVSSYLEASRGNAPADEVSDQLASAFASLETLLEINVRQSSDAASRAARIDRLANIVGAIALTLMVTLLAILVWWLWKRALAPILDLDVAMRSFGSGRRDARAPVAGAAELSRMAEAFNEMAEELALQRETQMTFLAGIAHDLRNPLGPLRAAVAVLAMEDRPSARTPAVLRVLERQVEHLDRLIGDLLEVARIEAGRLDLRLEEVDARSLAEEAVELFRPATPNIALQLWTPEVPVVLRCDPIRVQQVLNNLISNAIKYSRQDGQVAVSVHQGSSHVSFSVRDRGFGISEQDLSRLFEPFRRAKRAIDSPVSGAGLGLFVARRIVEAHGGKLEVVSVEGEGSTFRVELPVSLPDHAAIAR